MNTPLVLALISGATLSGLTVMFVRERTRGSRYAEGARSRCDRIVSFVASRLESEFPKINNQFFRELFHYVMHKILSLVLSVVRRAEGYLHRIAQFNRMKASEVKAARGKGTSSHLTEIADHKERTQLSDSEKQRRREEALNGGV